MMWRILVALAMLAPLALCQGPVTVNQTQAMGFSQVVTPGNQTLAPAAAQSFAANATSSNTAGPVTQEDFEQKVLRSKRPVLVDYWAPYCGPCRTIAPIVDELAAEYKGMLDAYKLNTDDSPSLATEYGILSIPTVSLFKGGRQVDIIIGVVPKSTLKDCIERVIA